MLNKGMKYLMSPANHAYLDRKYNAQTSLGLACACYCEVADAYNWDPTTLIPGVPETSIIGVEAPIWTETLTNIADVEYMAFPRLPAIAEIGWSPQTGRALPDFLVRLAAQGPRWMARGTNFYASTQVPWGADVAGLPVTSAARAVSGAVALAAVPGASLAQTVATIHWGDNSVSPGTLTGTEATAKTINSRYAVSGSHTYASDGAYSITVTVCRPGSCATSTTPVTVKAA